VKSDPTKALAMMFTAALAVGFVLWVVLDAETRQAAANIAEFVSRYTGIGR
jgi:hypothetical protein